MRLNKLKPAKGAKKAKLRVGRGGGSGIGKTCGLGHKGQHARAGGYHKVGFEGGQVPLQRRLPKFGFKSRKALCQAEVRLAELAKVDSDIIDMEILKSANIVSNSIKRVKIFFAGEFKRPVTIRGLQVTKGVRAAIEAAGGKIEN